MSNATFVKSREKLASFIATNAGALMLDLFHKNLKTEEKDRHDFVTELDKDIENMALKAVQQSFPEDSFYGEEYGGVDGTSGYTWVVDPIDGTNNFVRGLPLCGFQLALLKHDKPVYALIYRPFTQEMFTAEKGKGAFYKNILTGEESRLSVSKRLFEDAMVVYDTKVGSGDNPSTRALLKLADRVAATRVFGVAVFDLPVIASGSAEVLITGVAKRYDVAAGMLLIEEAGGEFYNIKGKEPLIDDTFIIFSTPTVKPDVLKALQEGENNV